MIATLEFLGMRKLIETTSCAETYDLALPLDSLPSTIAPIGQQLSTTREQYISLIFVAESNCRYGLPHEPKLTFIFDHAQIENFVEKGEKSIVSAKDRKELLTSIRELREQVQSYLALCTSIAEDNKRLTKENRRLKEEVKD